MTPDDLPEGGPPAADDGEGPRRGKGFKARKREDHALVLIGDLMASLDNAAQARRLLLELSRYYDPILGGAIVEIRHQREIMTAIEAGRREEARALVQARYDLYIKDRAHLGRGEEG